MEQFERIRRDRRVEVLSIRAQAPRSTVREALASAIPAERKAPERARPVFGPYEATVRQWLVDD